MTVRTRLAVPVGVALLALAGCGGGSSSGTTASSPAATSTAPTSSGTTTSTSPSPTSAAGRRASTVPAGTETGFVSADRAVRCVLGDDSARCDVDSPAYTKPPKPADCDAGWADGVQLTAGLARPTCSTDVVYDGTRERPAWFVDGVDSAAPNGLQTYYVLGEGHTLTTAALACTTARGGVTCRTGDGTHGFEVSRAALRTW